MRILVAVTGQFVGNLRVRRSTGELDTEGLERVLSEPSARAISLALQLKQHGATIVAVHVDKGGGEDILREALSYGIDQGILIEGAPAEATDAAVRAATIADVCKQNGPFELIIGPGRSAFAGFTGTMAAVAGELDFPCVHGVTSVRPDRDGFLIGYSSIFGEYDLRIPKPCVAIAGDVPPKYPTAWDIAAAYGGKGIMRVRADQYEATKPRSKRVRIVAQRDERRATEQVDGATLVRRLRSRALIGDAPRGDT